MTQADIWAWCIANWPSLPAALIMVKVYLKVRHFLTRLEELEKKVNRMFELCLEVNSDRAVELLRGKDSKKEDPEV